MKKLAAPTVLSRLDLGDLLQDEYHQFIIKQETAGKLPNLSCFVCSCFFLNIYISNDKEGLRLNVSRQS